MRKIITCMLFVMQVCFVFAQSGTGVSGKVVDSKTQKPLHNAVASVQNTNLEEVSNSEGKFVLKFVPTGNQSIIVKSTGYKDQTLSVEVIKGKIVDLGVIVLEEDVVKEEQTSGLIAITDNDLGDDNSGSESTSSLLQASRDAFNQSAAFNWGQARFKVRGLDNAYGLVLMNGVIMNKIYDDRPQYSNWGGLNDALRNQEFTTGSAPSDYTFGGVLGTNEINTRASLSRPGYRVSLAATNTNYSGRIMATAASGMRADGWAYVISASRRFAEEGYFEGTTYSSNSFYASVEKKITNNHSINFTSMYGQNNRGKNSPNTKEVTDLKGEQYNSYWGYQDGRKRNARVKTVEEPIFMLTDYWKINAKTDLTTSIAYQFGEIGNSRLTYQGGDNPDPTYYKNLPSYYTSYYDANGVYSPDYAGAERAKENFEADGQINWDQMIYANQNSGDGHSYYTLYEDRTDDKAFTANSIISTQLSDRIVFNAGASYRNLRSHNFQYMLDLLGGSYFKDITLFGVGDNQQQSDLNNPDRNVGVGDTFGYNYNLIANNLNVFTQFKFTYKKFDFYLSQTYARVQYQREGLYRNGYYPTSSYGKSAKMDFDNFGFKGGLTYKISGRQFLTFNGLYMTKAPSLRNVFNNARLNNAVIDGIDNENVSSLDASYIINAPKLKTRITAYFSKIKNQTETSFFFGDGAGIDDPGTADVNESNAFVEEIATNMNKRNIGLEFGFEYPITSTLKATASAAYGEYIYDNNPNISINVDALATATNTQPVVNFGEANIKNYRQSSMPQQAASVGLEYRDPKFWWVGANFNYIGANYIDIAPITRTSRFYDEARIPGVPAADATAERGAQLLKQEKFDDFTLLNINAGKSWRLGGDTLGINASLSNVLGTSYKTGGFEQARNSNFTQMNQDVSSGTPAFAPKYFYGYGRTFFLNLYFNF